METLGACRGDGAVADGCGRRFPAGRWHQRQGLDRDRRSFPDVRVDAICRQNGIEHLLTQPRSPTTTGKIERFHRSLRAEFLSGRAPFSSLKVAQQALDEWVAFYNAERPHQALQMCTPASRFS